MANRSGYDDVMLTKVVMGTDTAISEMHQLNNHVSYLSSHLPAVNNSTSGRRLGQLIADWTTDFHAIKGQLEALNGKAIGLRELNRGLEEETSGAPR
jgi:hypothetical protein